MDDGAWQMLIVAGLTLNALLGLGYRVYRLTRGGPIADVWGQAILAVLLTAIAAAIAADVDWARWIALAYALLFALLVMPVWVLGVLLPLPPGAVDYAFTATYWLTLVLIAVAAIAA